LGQLDLSRRRPGLGEVREVRRAEQQQQGDGEQDSQDDVPTPFNRHLLPVHRITVPAA
jgi:hypothetical protein